MWLHRFFGLAFIRFVLVNAIAFGVQADVVAASDKIKIVTDIAPIHSLVSMVVGQQADVELLVPPSQSPHSFSLKPSQVRVINQAALVVTLNDNFTPALSRHLHAIDNKAIVLKLSDSIVLQRFDAQQYDGTKKIDQAKVKPTVNKQSHNRSVESHINFAVNDNAGPALSHSEHLYDPHTWLNPKNAIKWLDQIAMAAIELDENNRSVYQKNADRAKNNLETMHEAFTLQLASVSSVSYVVYHDAYQHFAKSYGLQKPIAIALSDARAPGARKLRAIRKQAKQTKCVFSELLHEDSIVDTVTAGLPVRRAILDPMGSTISVGPNHYPQMMQALVNNFVACLS